MSRVVGRVTECLPWKWWLFDVELLYHALPVTQGTGVPSAHCMQVPRCCSLMLLEKQFYRAMLFPSSVLCCTGVHHMRIHEV